MKLIDWLNYWEWPIIIDWYKKQNMFFIQISVGSMTVKPHFAIKTTEQSQSLVWNMKYLQLMQYSTLCLVVYSFDFNNFTRFHGKIVLFSSGLLGSILNCNFSIWTFFKWRIIANWNKSWRFDIIWAEMVNSIVILRKVEKFLSH